MAPNNTQDANDRLLVEIRDLQDQISALQASNAAFQSQLEALQTRRNSDMVDLHGQISALKSANALFEQEVAAMQSACYQDSQSVRKKINGLESAFVFVDDKIETLKSSYNSKIEEISREITTLVNDDKYLDQSITTLENTSTQLINQALYADKKLLRLDSSLSKLSEEAAKFSTGIGEARAMFMFKLQNLEDNLNKVMRKNNMDVTELEVVEVDKSESEEHEMRGSDMKLVIRDQKVEENRLVKDEGAMIITDKNVQDSSANLVDTTNILAQVEQENQSRTEEIGRLQEELKKSKKFTFWAVLSSTVVTAASVAYVVWRRR